MSFFGKIDDAVDALASLITDSPRRTPIKIAIYLLLVWLLVWLPYSLIHHLHTSGFHVVSVQREKKVGLRVAEQLQKRMTLLPQDNPLAGYVSEIGQRIARNNNPWKADFTFSVIDDSRMINAFALPGGKIYITTGLLTKLDNEAELAAVLAHEVAHVSYRHYARNLGKQMLISWVKKFIGGTDAGIQEAGLFLTTNLTLLSMRQEDELEADYQGALYIYELGYDPAGAVTLTQKLLDIERKMPDLIKMMVLTHPPSVERVEAMKELEESLPKKGGLRLGAEEYSEMIRSQNKTYTHHDRYRHHILEPFKHDRTQKARTDR